MVGNGTMTVIAWGNNFNFDRQQNIQSASLHFILWVPIEPNQAKPSHAKPCQAKPIVHQVKIKTRESGRKIKESKYYEPCVKKGALYC